MVMLATLTLVAALAQTPRSPVEPSAFSPVLEPAAWRLWVTDAAPQAAEITDARYRRSAVAANPVPGDGGLLMRLPDDVALATGWRDCWLTAAARLDLRRVAPGRYAALVTVDQAGATHVLGAEAVEHEGRLVFDRLLPWGPCREARILDDDGTIQLKPVAVGPPEPDGDVPETSRTLVVMPYVPPKPPSVLSEAEWTLWTGEALSAILEKESDGTPAVAHQG
ncbi:MAG TPA: hypothetical protein VFF65_11800, partial [Phycisphaerales bacterium]|nr:hypothetical protein [Phycisphaerales bacterium]